MNKFITKPEDLITSREETRSGFIAFALEKNRKSAPYVAQARSLKVLAAKARTPRDLLSMKDIEKALLTAAGLSDKALKYFRDEDKIKAIEELITNFLEPAVPDFVDELVYRYLLIKGDSLGGSMRNIVGSIGQQKLVRMLLSVLHLHDTSYKWLANSHQALWVDMPEDETLLEQGTKAIAWVNESGPRVLAFNLTVPLVRKNIDICLFNGTISTYNAGRIHKDFENTILLGELKAGIDPAGADEHWKTANSALRRITDAYNSKQHSVKSVYIGAAIEKAMAMEIFSQLNANQLSNAANLSNEEQMVEVCEWLARL